MPQVEAELEYIHQYHEALKNNSKQELDNFYQIAIRTSQPLFLIEPDLLIFFKIDFTCNIGSSVTNNYVSVLAFKMFDY